MNSEDRSITGAADNTVFARHHPPLAGFPRVHFPYAHSRRCGVVAHRGWEPVAISTGAAAPFLCSAVNNRHNDVIFSEDKDEYLVVSFLHEGALAKDGRLCGSESLRSVRMLPAGADCRYGAPRFLEKTIATAAPFVLGVENTMDGSQTFRVYRNEKFICEFTHPDSALDLSTIHLGD